MKANVFENNLHMIWYISIISIDLKSRRRSGTSWAEHFCLLDLLADLNGGPAA